MKAACSSCGKPFVFDDSRFRDRDSLKVRCPSCKEVTTLTRPAPEQGPPTQKLKRDQVVAGPEGGEVLLPMPKDLRVSLAILTGKNAGQVIPCGKSQVVLGRTGADVTLDDEEVSRRHAMVEIRDERFFLKDLGSTNGTFVDERKIAETEILDRAEFRVGSTQIMLIVTPNEEI